MIVPLRDRLRWPTRPRWLTHPRWALAAVGGAVAVVTAVAVLMSSGTAPAQRHSDVSLVEGGEPLPSVSETVATASPTPSATPTTTPASPAANLRVIDYTRAPTGFPADPEPASTAQLTEGAHPTKKIVAYDAPGGQPRAYLAPTINGVQLTMPIVERSSGWIAVLLPSANRTIAWLAPAGAPSR